MEVAAGLEEEDEVAEMRRARFEERVVGPEEEEEGAAEVASARFRLRVSIQKPQPLGFKTRSPPLGGRCDHAHQNPISRCI